MTSRTIKFQHPAYRDDIADLSTVRPLPGPHVEQIDPFLFLNHHGPQVYQPNNAGLPFGPHPHRGFETVTFILAGELSHLDSGGHENIIGAGGVQWMTAGSGLIHAELSPESFKRSGGLLEILQLWVNLPARLKMTKPAYIGLQKDQIPEIPLDGGRVKVKLASGEFAGTTGPIASLTGISLMTVAMQPKGAVTLPAPPGHNVFLYTVRGNTAIDGVPINPQHLIELNDDGDAVNITAFTDALILYGHAAPLNEPVVAHGPFVMNSREEISQAIRDYQSGAFGNVTPGTR
ncbi:MULTISPECIES: pirin family protein [unclassified Brenneria]|uniref:pirin family protein n=1 Tax=unclassified Brenneria TaxID=2634434 RepID=UPI0029C2BF14|nr:MULTISPECIES: pirin family protein [unclassified Brenneria]MDX5627588.1 pirin family protein [Brenneria sp. L3-3Z]MDX5695321.1 pirin family protein [Brenneria sp. L4-2C]MEE3664156.1 pirin family protein [Brenneria sp. g21c3]